VACVEFLIGYSPPSSHLEPYNSLVVLCETNLLSLISQCLDKNSQIQTKYDSEKSFTVQILDLHNRAN
jgi:hypothetical protein